MNKNSHISQGRIAIGSGSGFVRLVAITVFAATLSLPAAARADCFDESAQYHKVNPWVLRAIAAVESGFRPATIVGNTNGTLDRGMTGINSVHLPELSRYGITTGDLMDACKSVYLAGWHLRRKINEGGNTWESVGAYHSKTPSKRDVYVRKIQRVLAFWVARGIMPSQG